MGIVVTTRDIAKECGVLPGTVRQWRKRFPDFPMPTAEYGGTLVYDWARVEAWLFEHQRNPTPVRTA
jgi:hypothetical protein